MRKTTKTVEKLKVTIKRPSGEIEVVYKTDNVRYIGTIERVQDQVTKATKEAGQGDIQSFDIVSEEIPMTLEEIRESIRTEIGGNIEMQDDARERDYNEDIGFQESVKFDDVIKNLRVELKEFDAKHPEILAEIHRKEEIRTEQLIQSAMNS